MHKNSITIIAKPTSECNFRCAYCYHATTHYEEGILAVTQLEKLIRLAQEEYDRVEYVWHGGEPLLCGVDYFRNIIELQRKWQRKSLVIDNSVQTNGYLLSEQFIHFFRKHNFSVSVSLDGPADCNTLRQSTNEVIDRIASAQEAGLRLSTISVIHALNYDHQIEMYEFFKSMRLPMKFNPIFNCGSTEENSQYLLAIAPYVSSLKALYDYWLLDQTAVPVDPLDQYIHMKLFGKGIDCIYGSCLYHWIGIDHNGDIYPCGRSFGPDYQIGTITEIRHISDVFKNSNFIDLLRKSIIRRSICQNTCGYYGICEGGCNNNALIENGSVEVNGGVLCDVLREMYDYIGASIDSIFATKEPLDIYNPLVKHALNKKRLNEVFGDK